MQIQITLTDQSNINPGYLKSTIQSPWGGESIIASSADDSIGVGNLLKIPFDELISINYNDGGISITVNTTEGIQVYECYDLVVLGDLNEWCKQHEINLIFE